MIEFRTTLFLSVALACSLVSFRGFADINNNNVSYEFLNSDLPVKVFLDTSAFAVENLNTTISLPNSGHLTIDTIKGKEKLKILRDKYSMAKNTQLQISQLPSLEFDFVVYQNYLVPSIQSVQ
ncbi:MAG: hypothetical protein L3J46_08595, partial [Kangiellaceae bacterium]|nr:hypothetical protein [Kangiellaceae bacterium]